MVDSERFLECVLVSGLRQLAGPVPPEKRLEESERETDDMPTTVHLAQGRGEGTRVSVCVCACVRLTPPPPHELHSGAQMMGLPGSTSIVNTPSAASSVVWRHPFLRGLTPHCTAPENTRQSWGAASVAASQLHKSLARPYGNRESNGFSTARGPG